jgi:uridine kinase
MLALHLSRSSFGSQLIGFAFSLSFITYHFFFSSGSQIVFLEDFFINQNVFEVFTNSLQIKNLLNTFVIGLVALITLQMFSRGIRGSDYYHLGKKPIVLGIAGDSGTGKTTFSEALVKLFGENQAVELVGDDYHNWDRSSPMWKTLTHLNPRANNLFKMVSDLDKMLDGEFVKVRSYNHITGRFMSEIRQKGNQVILVSGLHALYPKQLVDIQDVSFFMEIEEDLRARLKINRDTKKRHKDKEQTLSDIERRKVDAKKYIEPQKENADINFKILPIKQENNTDLPLEKNLKLKVKIKNGAYYQELLRVLIGVCGLQVNIEEFDEKGDIELDIQGDVQPEDLQLASGMITPHLGEFIVEEGGFNPGMTGVMQLIAMIEIDQALRNRKR